jgi:hypothetical protein
MSQIPEGYELIESDWLRVLTSFIGPGAMAYMRMQYDKVEPDPIQRGNEDLVP